MKPIFDPTEAIFAGVTSVWGRLLLFFGAAFLGHFLGYIAAYTVEGDPFSIEVNFGRLAVLPAFFFWQILQNFLYGYGLIYIGLLGVCFFLICFTEVLPIVSLSIFVIVQIWDSFFMQRAIASRSYFYRAPDFSDWGYVIAGSFTLVAVVLLLLPSVLPRILGRITRD